MHLSIKSPTIPIPGYLRALTKGFMKLKTHPFQLEWGI